MSQSPSESLTANAGPMADSTQGPYLFTNEQAAAIMAVSKLLADAGTTQNAAQDYMVPVRDMRADKNQSTGAHR